MTSVDIPASSAYDVLLGNGPGHAINRSWRGILEQMEAHGWTLIEQLPRIRITRWAHPDGRSITVQFPSDKRPHVSLNEPDDHHALGYRQALAYVVTPRIPDPGPPSIMGAARQLGLEELIADAGVDLTLQPLLQARRDLTPPGGFANPIGPAAKTCEQVMADLFAAAEHNRLRAKERSAHDGGCSDRHSVLLQQRAGQFEAVGLQLAKMTVARHEYRNAVADAAARPLDIRPARVRA